MDEAVAMARSLAGAGFATVHCTPHCIRGAYDTSPAVVRSATAELQQLLDGKGIALRLRPGMEYYLDEFFPREEELQPMGDSPLILVEAPSQANAEVVIEGLQRVVADGFTPLIAHPERTEIFLDFEFNSKLKTKNSKLPEKLLFQANIGSFTGQYGSRVQRRAYDLLRAGRYSLIGSDGHDSARLENMLESWQDKLDANPALRLLAGLNDDPGEAAGCFPSLAFAGG